MTTNIGSSTSFPAIAPSLSETADIQVALRLLSYGISTEPTADTDITINSIFGNIKYGVQPAPTTLSTTQTLTISQLLTKIIQASPTEAINLTLPSGSSVDSGIYVGTTVNVSFDWSVINTSSTSGAVVTILAATGNTIVGSPTVAIGTSGIFRTRKTASNTFITYRIS